MSNAVIIIGDSGSGKSSAISKLDPAETFVIQSIQKDLPWKGSRKQYGLLSNSNLDGNRMYQPDLSKIADAIKYIADKQLHIKTIIVDDANYLQSDMYLDRQDEKAYFDKFKDIARHIKDMIKIAGSQRGDLDVFFMWHSTVDDNGRIGLVTLGKYMDQHYKIEGAFTIVLFATKKEAFGQQIEYKFITGNKVMNIAKSPLGMFPLEIPNDLKIVKQQMYTYYNYEDTPVAAVTSTAINTTTDGDTDEEKTAVWGRYNKIEEDIKRL